MPAEVLQPSLDLLRQEYVLVQAWKKASSYIRAHNWYADTLELDRAAVNLPRFLRELTERLEDPFSWTNDPLRIVPAPKSQAWHVTGDGNEWQPRKSTRTGVKLRPLAHVSLKDQVIATALMLCLADRVESAQRDPRTPVSGKLSRERVISYGNRLFCDSRNDLLYHRWGSGKLYRSYYKDYRSFLARPETVAKDITVSERHRVVIAHSDLSQFYDRVTPVVLREKLSGFRVDGDDNAFYELATRVLDWRWDARDLKEVATYVAQAKLADFLKVALPQGLVSAGFFANVTLVDLDNALRKFLLQEISPGIQFVDVCRYVDDLRLVLVVEKSIQLSQVKQLIGEWLQSQLDEHAPGLQASEEKTKVAVYRGDERPLVRQSRRMERIQVAISGGFDAVGGEEILDAVQGLIKSQERYSESRPEEKGWPLSPVADVRDATVARFAAGRFRSTFRSLRPLLSERDTPPVEVDPTDKVEDEHSLAGRSRVDLDDEARAYALGLIEDWVQDPSNVRLLRIGLDLWPAVDVIQRVLQLLKPYTERGGRRKSPRRVAWYCLAEVFRAAATETGLVEDSESLPKEIDIDSYRRVLVDEAIRLMSLPGPSLPWYLRQQILLFLAATDPASAPVVRVGKSPETKHYRELIRFLRGESERVVAVDFATLAIIARRSYCDRDFAMNVTALGLTSRRLEQIAERDPSFAYELVAANPAVASEVSPRVRDDLCIGTRLLADGWRSLAEVCLSGGPTGQLRNEFALLRFASKFLNAWEVAFAEDALTPSDIHLLDGSNGTGAGGCDFDIRISPSRVTTAGSMYLPPAWCSKDDRWRFQLGYLLRFILSGQIDFTRVVKPPSWRESTKNYRPPESSWYQRLYGLFNGHSAFGADWLPISNWTEEFLFRLLWWPGCHSSEIDVSRQEVCKQVDERVRDLEKRRGSSTGLLMLPLTAPWPVRPARARPLRACVVQTVIPSADEYHAAALKGDLTLSGSEIRSLHRNHLASALAAIERMLDLRETHVGRKGRLDWLILPELAVHPRDVKTHLVPFARAHKAIIVAGMAYEEIIPEQPLVNSALWIIPEWSSAHGLQVRVRRQGKRHLAPEEMKLNAGGGLLQGFRPCQWIVNYQWSGIAEAEPLRLTAAICYDATDISLAADLRQRSDVFVIPALNKDVGTFDQIERVHSN